MFVAPAPRIHYYRLRASTLNANVPEPFFQTLERHWDMVVERVAAFIDTLVHRVVSLTHADKYCWPLPRRLRGANQPEPLPCSWRQGSPLLCLFSTFIAEPYKAPIDTSANWGRRAMTCP
jgi:hypothetical protein